MIFNLLISNQGTYIDINNLSIIFKQKSLPKRLTTKKLPYGLTLDIIHFDK
jgi:hypothetical protein